jgi:hypothetical protein
MKENLAAADAVASRLIRLHRESVKPWVAVVDAGEIFDPLVRYMELSGVPTFRSADRGLRALGRLHEARSGRPS